MVLSHSARLFLFDGKSNSFFGLASGFVSPATTLWRYSAFDLNACCDAYFLFDDYKCVGFTLLADKGGINALRLLRPQHSTVLHKGNLQGTEQIIKPVLNRPKGYALA